jgi:hypothetical protein
MSKAWCSIEAIGQPLAVALSSARRGDRDDDPVVLPLQLVERVARRLAAGVPRPDPVGCAIEVALDEGRQRGSEEC